jgi:hypothetical protein
MGDAPDRHRATKLPQGEPASAGGEKRAMNDPDILQN